jgi:hypothetical protein
VHEALVGEHVCLAAVVGLARNLHGNVFGEEGFESVGDELVDSVLPLLVAVCLTALAFLFGSIQKGAAEAVLGAFLQNYT